jgi:hypothetical protein
MRRVFLANFAGHSFNLFFIRNDFLDKLNLDPNKISDPNNLFNYRWVERAARAAFKKERRQWKQEKQLKV